MKKILYCPSILAANPWDLKEYISEFSKAEIDMIHFDVMDGQFVPNIALSTQCYNAVHSITDMPIDLHLMCLEPEKIVDYFDVKAGDCVAFHPEVCHSPYSLLSKIRKMGARAGIALSPGTPINWIDEFHSVLDFVLVMAVEPGFSHQKMLPDTLSKIERIAKLREERGLNFDIAVDGNCTAENVSKMIKAGANHFDVGSALVSADKDAKDFCNDFEDYKIKLKNMLD